MGLDDHADRRAAGPTDRRASGRRKSADLSVREVADVVGVHMNTVLGWLKADKLRGYLAGRIWRIPIVELQKFRRQQKDDRDAAERDD